MTGALGWCMGQVPGLTTAIASEAGAPVPGPCTAILLQEHGGETGITDIEVQFGGKTAWIIEAKAASIHPRPSN